MRRADRLFRIVQTLRGRRLVTAARLAEELGVSERTIYRDIRDLSLSGVPVEGEAGVGYVLRGGFDLPPLMFTAEEITALAVGARIARSWTDPELGRAAEAALEKIEQALPERLRGRVETTPLMAPLVRISPEVAATMHALRQAIDDRKKVAFAYTRADGDASHRTVWPLGLFYWGAAWTLGAWCELRGAFRNFRLDRMQVPETRADTYPSVPGRTLGDLIREAERQMEESA